jgi:hypothetical protein
MTQQDYPPDFQALCAELADELEDWIAYGDEADCADAHAVVDRARAALAQPEPQGPTEDEWDALKDRLWNQYETIGHQGERFMYDGDFGTALDVARQELSRWGK